MIDQIEVSSPRACPILPSVTDALKNHDRRLGHVWAIVTIRIVSVPSRFTAVAVLALSVAPALADGTHTAEIEAFASAMAIARTVRDCPGTTPDDAYLEALRVTCTSSRPALLLGYMQQAEVLQQGLADAPCRQAWCNAVFRLYEPKA